MKPYGIIYLITNLINMKGYVGQTIQSIEKRWKNGHIYESKKNNPSQVLYRAIKKYGIDNFEIEEICTADNQEELDIKEQYWIFELNTFIDNNKGYNMTWGGNSGGIPCELTRKRMSVSRTGSKNGMFGKRFNHTQETRQKMKISHTGKPSPRKGQKMSDEQKLILSNLNSGEKNPNYNKKFSEETRKKMRDSHLGKKHTEEHKRKISMSGKGKNTKPKSEEHKRKISESLKRRKSL
jgi:group I intron endonuclease